MTFVKTIVNGHVFAQSWMPVANAEPLETVDHTRFAMV